MPYAPHPRSFFAVLALCALALAAPAPSAAQVVPSSYTPLGICSIYSNPTTANTTVFLQVRDRCGIPQTANAVALVATTSGAAGAGELFVWDAGINQPSIASLLFRAAPGGDSSTLLVRLCYPLLECGSVDEEGAYHGTDLHARLTAGATLALSAVGYFEPLP